MGSVEDNIMSLFKTNTTEDFSKPTSVNNVYGGVKKQRKPKIKKQLEENIIKDVRNLFSLKKENEAIKNRIIRVIKNLFELEKKIIIIINQ